jgi:DNA-binding NarL/FixJ family response regulator
VNGFFAKMGQLITDSGTDNFVAGVHRLINDYVPVDVTEATNWILDKTSKKVATIQRLGAWGAAASQLSFGQDTVQSCEDGVESSILRKIVNSEDSHLIHLRPRTVFADIHDNSLGIIYQCILLSHQENRRHVVSLFRAAQPRDFSLQELSVLKHLSDAILPAVGYHARRKIREPKRDGLVATPPGAAENHAVQLQRNFDGRLNDTGVALSSREYQVCLAHLLGNTLPAIARQLSVRESTAATYFKRASIKLNLSGRHGFAKWMLGTASHR